MQRAAWNINVATRSLLTFCETSKIHWLVVCDRSMSTLRPTSSRKRLCPRFLLSHDGLPHRKVKKQKTHHPKGSQPPPAFWDNLSQIWLTRNALRELDRKNKQSTQSADRHRCRQFAKPVTRHALAEWKRKEEDWRPAQPVDEFLRGCLVQHLNCIRSTARLGGPDLSDLRGVCVPFLPSKLVLTSVSIVSKTYQPSFSYYELQPV